MNKTNKREDNLDLKINNYLNPDNIYIPIKKGYRIVANGDVQKEDVILSDSKSEIYSPISGNILGVTNSIKIKDSDCTCLVIENNFKEHIKKNKGINKTIENFSVIELINILNKNGINIKDGDYSVLLINGIDKDPYSKTISSIINNYSDEILETIDAIRETLDIKSTILAISSKDSTNVINLSNNIGTYPYIRLKLVNSSYPIGFKEVLAKNIISKRNINSYLYFTVSEILDIYNILKRNKPIIEKIITIGGNAIKRPMLLNVKIGTLISDIIKNNCDIINNNYHVVINGLISGYTLVDSNMPVTNDIDSIFINTIDNTIEKDCINCGLCNKKCPMGLNPKYIRSHKKADKSKCINCGLCTYICPSKINFKPYLGGNEYE